VSFDPEAVRDFEHAGWQRAAASYSATFARATSGFIASLLDAARVGLRRSRLFGQLPGSIS
jgi:hypothetical protein